MNALENKVVLRIEFMIREDESNWHFNTFSPLLLLKKIYGKYMRILVLIVGFKGLTGLNLIIVSHGKEMWHVTWLEKVSVDKKSHGSPF